MKKNMKWLLILLAFTAALCAFDIPAFAAESVTAIGGAVQAAPANCADPPVIELSVPGGEKDKSYLGLSGSGNFKIGQIKSQILIIEILSFYCPHCQLIASRVNDLYEEVQRRSDLNGKVKIIGIGAKNSVFEVDSFREKYHVPFPLFPDKDLELTQKLCVKGTPTFVGFRVDGNGLQERFYFGEGGFTDIQKFLTEIIQASGLK